MKNLFSNFNGYFKENKERCLTILTIIILSILSSIILISYSFYQNKSSKLIISGVALIDSSDVSIKVYRENKNDSGTGLNTYSLSYYVPSSTSYSYVSSKTVCDTGITIEKYENQKFYVDATKKGKCKVYFDAIDGFIDDYEVNLFVQQEAGNTDDKNYNQMGQLPLYETGYYYTVNTNKTNCTNGATVSIEGRSVVVLTTQKAVCNVYADKNSDSVSPVISSLSVGDTTVTFTATDNISLVFYGVSDSNTIEPEEYSSFSGTSQTVSFTQNTEGTYYLWVKDSSNNITTKEFTISLGISVTTLISASTADVYDENGLRFEGKDPNNYICLDNQSFGSCVDSSLVFRIIGIFEEETSIMKTLLKIVDTNNYGGTTGKYWSGSSSISSNNWSNSNLQNELNDETNSTGYLYNLINNSNVDEKLSDLIASARWQLGGANNTSSSNYYYQKVTASSAYTLERSPYATSGSLQNRYSGNSYFKFAKVGLMYPRDYGYATTGGTNTSKATCRTTAIYNYDIATDCYNNNWIFTSQKTSWGSNKTEWLISPYSANSTAAARLFSTGIVNYNGTVNGSLSAVRPTMYLITDNLSLIGTGTLTNPYRIS